MDVGSNIRSLRLARGLTQEDLAATLFVSRQTISHWESNRTSPDAQSLVMMSALFEVSVDTLVKGGVETMVEVQAQQARRTRVSWASGALIGLAGCAVVAPPLVAAMGPLPGGMLSLAPLATTRPCRARHGRVVVRTRHSRCFARRCAADSSCTSLLAAHPETSPSR